MLRVAWIAVLATGLLLSAPVVASAAPDGRITYNMNVDWKFYKGHVVGAQNPDFDDSSWQTVSVPHTFNDVDAFDEYVTSGGDNVWRGSVWYRKRFKLDDAHAGKKVFIEFEGVRQAAYVYVNGEFAGRYEAGVTPFGFDITDFVHFGDDPNVIAVRNDNGPVAETGTNTQYQWNHRPFNPIYGGLTRDVKLHVMDRVYFTLPLYSNLGTYGSYIYPTDISTEQRTATINVEAEVKNDSDGPRSLSVEAVVIDMDGNAVMSVAGEAQVLPAGATRTFVLAAPMEGVHFWQPGYPYLYTVRLILREDGQARDVYEITTGFRKVEFLGGWNQGGVFINNQHVYLSGYAQRSTNEWALLGAALPQWVTDYDGQLMLESNANLVRWMHISPTPGSIRMTDKYGIVSIHPAGDSEKDVQGRQWEQRVEVMRDTIIYFRNNPSILFWEAGNNTISPEHMREMRELKDKLDPHGMRAIGSRGLAAPAAVDAAEYVATMLNRHYTDYARDQVPIIESEYMRDEAPRRVWDDHSPPDFGYFPNSASVWNWNSEEFAVMSTAHFWEFYKDRIQGPDSSNEMYSGQAALIWADSNQHGRNYMTETARVSGRVDALRLPKESFYAFRVIQSAEPDIHIVGHWSYPQGTRKDVYVIANHVTSVELFVNGVSKGVVTDPTAWVDAKRGATHPTPYVFTFPQIAWESGVVKAIGYDADGAAVVETQKETAGPPAAIRLTPMTGPDGWRADGVDVAIIDVEVVDAQGRRVPTDQARIDFEYSGEGKFLGGYNVGRLRSGFRDYIDTEAGVNRVIVRSTRNAGEFTLVARRDGLEAATITLESAPFEVADGLTTQQPASMTFPLPPEPPQYGPDEREPRPIKPILLSSGKPAIASGEETGKGNLAGNANDGSPTSRWAASDGQDGHWWQVDLQGVYELTGTQVDWYRENTYYQYKIEVSLDDRNWTEVVDRTGNTLREQTMTDEFSATARFVRITVTGKEAGWASMYEFRVFGVGGGGSGEWKPPSVSSNYDFGATDSPLEAGYVRVSDDTPYTLQWQFGFDDLQSVEAFDRGQGPSDLTRDFIVGNNATFRVDLDNGDYDVTVVAGDELASNRTDLRIQGESRRTLASEPGSYDQATFKARVDDGQLVIAFSGRVNAIEIMPLPPVPKGLTLRGKGDDGVILGWTPINGAMGYNVYRALDGGADAEWIGETAEPVFVDSLVGVEAETASYRVTSIMEMGEITLVGESFPTDPLDVDLTARFVHWDDAFFIVSDYFSTVNPLADPPILQLMPELPPDVAPSELTWVSSRPDVASVDPSGLVTALRPGAAEITASTADGRFSAATRVHVPVISESFGNQRVGDGWGAQTGTAGGSGNLGGAIASISGNHVFMLTGGGTGVRSTQKRFPQAVAAEKVRVELDWHVGSPANSLGAQLSIEDSNGARYLTLQHNAGQPMVYHTGGTAANEAVSGQPVGRGVDRDDAVYRVQVDLDFVNRTIDLALTDVERPEIAADIVQIPFDEGTLYRNDVGRIHFVLARASGTTTSWTTWIDNLNVYAWQ